MLARILRRAGMARGSCRNRAFPPTAGPQRSPAPALTATPGRGTAATESARPYPLWQWPPMVTPVPSAAKGAPDAGLGGAPARASHCRRRVVAI